MDDDKFLQELFPEKGKRKEKEIFLPKLSQNLLEILNDEEYYDVIIEVGKDPDVKIFHAHMVILFYRSPYLRRILSTNKRKNDGTLTHIKLPNIFPEIFPIILRYIYGGNLPLEEYDTLDIIQVLIAASELSLQELIIYLQSFLIENKANWMEQNFYFVYQTSFKNDSLLVLQKYCTDLMTKEPDKIFNSPNFSSISEKNLITIIQSDDLQMSEIQIWEHVLKWGLAQNPELPSDITNYSKGDFTTLKNTLERFIPFIKFYNLSSKDFIDKVLPYKRILPEELFEDLFKAYLSLLNPDSKPSDKLTSANRHNGTRRSDKGAYKMQGPNIGLERFAPLEFSENRWVPQFLRNPLPKYAEDFIPFDIAQRKVNALLNKLTLRNFDSLSNQIIDYANKSRDERDGRILRGVVH
ncbi:hypothetical protein RclHR1_04670006 [Rhizophagus clarus]|uniref:BTB/POZ protein n=1 Tax=Rhizophagus clarus TaxID=94130 RepID=A0A2Z6RI93_9GLOM|nr:hypothetical protein RclHR1_04670006 [Rhizophagus clarus]GES76354.1 BTB/POZ protein [Rhizophagus clarus]